MKLTNIFCGKVHYGVFEYSDGKRVVKPVQVNDERTNILAEFPTKKQAIEFNKKLKG